MCEGAKRRTQIYRSKLFLRYNISLTLYTTATSLLYGGYGEFELLAFDNLIMG